MSAAAAIQTAVYNALRDDSALADLLAAHAALSGSPAHYLALPGDVGNYASTPDSAAISIIGDIWVEAEVDINSVASGTSSALLAKIEQTGSQRSFEFYLFNDTLSLLWYTDGSNGAEMNCTVPMTTGHRFVAATLDVDNGAGGWTGKFYTSEDGKTWSQLGSTRTGTPATSIFNSTARLNAGARRNDGSADLWSGRLYRARLRNGYDGAGEFVADFNPGAFGVLAGAASITSATGEVWTINSTGSPNAYLASLYPEPAIYDQVPQAADSEDPAAFPYVVIGDDTMAEFDTDDWQGQVVTLTLHIWDRYGGRLRVKQIQDAVYAILHDATLEVDDHRAIYCLFDFAESMKDPDGISQHGVVRYRIAVQQD